LEHAEIACERAERELAEAEADLHEQARRLSEARRAAAPELAERVREELAALAMDRTTFEIELHARDSPGPSGAEQVEFLLGPNPGVPPAALREVASGGELSRVMLALMSVAGAGTAETLAFDEVDAGIGGQTARVVGERLRALAEDRQVLCITHLPQIAALADRHFRIDKRTDSEVASAEVEELSEDGVVAELCRMLGAEASDAGARRHAQELLAA
jgi:DNA repair protein RecN (Recombination protein N)